ncbi:MAG TPA: HlyD family secretion protein [Oculatellaceae cyanobacterium]
MSEKESPKDAPNSVPQKNHEAGPATTSAATASPPSVGATNTSLLRSLPSSLVPVAIFAAAAILFVLISSNWTFFENKTAIKTDDAYVRADVAPLSTKVSGIVRAVLVNDFQHVKTGQILVELKNDEYKARVEEARQAITQAELKLADIKTRRELQDAKISQATSVIDISRSSVSQSKDQVAEGRLAIDAETSGSEALQAAVAQARAAVQAASADLTRSDLERQRQEALLKNESTTNEVVEKVENEYQRAAANLEAQKAALARAIADLSTQRTRIRKAKEQYASAIADQHKASVNVDSHRDDLIMRSKERELLDSEEKLLQSEVRSRKAALQVAQADLDYTIVRAPADGQIGEIKAKAGQLVGAGAQVMTLVSAKPWIVANYRETQLATVKEGDPVEISIDALPVKNLTGHVEQIAPASGAQFSLLPPENATGNFTKIVQRIPVKIAFDNAEQSALRPGMSAIVTIKPRAIER